MAEMAAPAALAEEKPKRGKLPLILVVVALLAAGAGAYLFLGGSGSTDPAAAVEEPAPVEGPVVDVTTMTVNLGGGDQQYARVGYAVVLDATADPAAVEARFALLKDAALSRIAAYSSEQLLSPVGMDSLRGDLTAAAQEVWPDGEVLRVVLTELIVQ